MKLTRDHYFAARPFLYGGDDLDKGQVVGLKGLVNDDKLIRIRYFRQCHPRQEAVECGNCGAWFIGEHFREAHGDLRHAFECTCGRRFDTHRSLSGHLAHCEVYRESRKEQTPV